MFELPRFAGLEKHRSDADRVEFVRVIRGAGYDPVAVAAVIEIESNRSWDPSVHGPAGSFTDYPGYPVGLIQFAPSTARGLGTTSEQLEQLSFAEQLPFVVAYYNKYGGPSKFQRPGDYYLAGWGAPPSTPDNRVLAVEGSAAYKGNTGLDTNKDGTIIASELRGLIDATIANARKRGTFLVDDSPRPSPSPLGPNWVGFDALAASAFGLSVAAIALAARKPAK